MKFPRLTSISVNATDELLLTSRSAMWLYFLDETNVSSFRRLLSQCIRARLEHESWSAHVSRLSHKLHQFCKVRKFRAVLVHYIVVRSFTETVWHSRSIYGKFVHYQIWKFTHEQMLQHPIYTRETKNECLMVTWSPDDRSAFSWELSTNIS